MTHLERLRAINALLNESIIEVCSSTAGRKLTAAALLAMEYPTDAASQDERSELHETMDRIDKLTASHNGTNRPTV